MLTVGLLGVLVVGIVAYVRSRPPEFDTVCHFEEQEVRQDQPTTDVHFPPPSNEVGQTEQGQSLPPNDDAQQAEQGQSLPLFTWDQLASRVGFGLTGSQDVETWARRLGAGWYVDWTFRLRHPTELPEHWQMVRLARGCVAPSRENIRWLAQHYSGNVWIIGNEPDNRLQDNIVPEEYAQVYHDLYYLIKDADSTASVAVGGVTQGTPLRLAYLDRVLAAYLALYEEPMPVDWWTLHGFVLREERGNWGAGIPAGFLLENQGKLYDVSDSGDLINFQEQIIAFRSWMADNGYRNNPLAITEFGILTDSEYGYTPDVVAQYLHETFEWLEEASDDETGYPDDENRLVQRWAWFSLSDPLYPGTSLANLQADALTEIGQAFREYNWERRH
ncbi:MAG: hypothetical protein U9Q82_01530 [Chloroflexota bacterium]|nr:hypothetical protein [Chloroflexota bacterium]